jgi:Zn-dependent metalloprotease
MSALGLCLALGASPLAAAPSPRLDKAVLAQQQRLQPVRMLQAQSHLLALRAQLGLSDKETFVPRGAFTNELGETIVRLEQTFEGRRVWGGQAIAHVDGKGVIQTLTQSVRPGIALQGAPLLTADFAKAIAVAHLAPKGTMKVAPVVEQVVFPAEFVGGLATQVDPVTGRQVLDRRNTIIARPNGPYVWAYEVRTRVDNLQDGTKALNYLIDGNTGKILRITDLIQHLEAPTPAQGKGKGFYRGDVDPLDTSLMLDGTFTLWDQTRGTQPNPYLSYFSADPPTGWDPTIPGNQIWYKGSDTSGASTYTDFLFQGNTTNTWGDGLPFTNWGDSGGTNGQTAGVDAASAIASTWDFYASIFGRNGVDGQGTSVVALVLDPTLQPWFNGLDNAYWDVQNHTATFGAGSFPTNPKGFQSLVDLDVVAHELAHGLTSPSTAQSLVAQPGYEEGGIAEALSDFFSQMVKTWAGRDAAAPADQIPATTLPWEIGRNVGHGAPIRYMDKPSQDGWSYDAWFQGIRRLDPHHSSGPINRALYFLSQGSSSTPGTVNYSSCLPEGMKGVGNDIAARIVYKAVTEYFIGDGTGAWTFEDLRAACIAAAEHLPYPYELGRVFDADAVRNAFAAANIGDGAGKAATTRVLFTPWRNGDYIQLSHPWSDYSNRQILPMNETVVPRVTVINNANTAVTWSLGGPATFDTNTTPGAIAGGVINADGSWTTPNQIGWASMTATSKADPNQFAEGIAWLANLDTDMDLENDALDMAPIAISWYLSDTLNYSSSVIAAPWVDDLDVSFFVDAIKSTWPVK